ncbi:hypothetical protein BKA65DRAFT_553539 [Rhexocercosporidium sp. MPI-PUGE-AT-0058]|nr:hypothetical protein BKA65DRAFT_553539 [Rhexocercosporidium sp. MPI-PUGE-AT-0058]
MTQNQGTPQPPVRLTAAYDFAEFPPIDGKPLFGEFARLQRLNLVQMQNELASIKADQTAGGGLTDAQVKDLRRTMHEYITAIKDLEYTWNLTEVSDDDGREYQIKLQEAFPDTASKTGAPYNTTYRTFRAASQQKPDAVREFLRNFLYRKLSWTQAERDAREDDYWHGKPPYMYSTWVDRLARFIMAFVGGAALVVPMVVMVFHPSRNKSLITTSVSVLLFAAFLALGINSSNQDTLAATATYAAVLVVFVGTSGTSNSTGTG